MKMNRRKSYLSKPPGVGADKARARPKKYQEGGVVTSDRLTGSRLTARQKQGLDLGPPMIQYGTTVRRDLKSAQQGWKEHISTLPYANTPGWRGKIAHQNMIKNNPETQRLATEIRYLRHEVARHEPGDQFKEEGWRPEESFGGK